MQGISLLEHFFASYYITDKRYQNNAVTKRIIRIHIIDLLPSHVERLDHPYMPACFVKLVSSPNNTMMLGYMHITIIIHE